MSAKTPQETILWRDREAADATSGTRAGPSWSATGVSIDSREIEGGELFVALTDARDGHDFVADALAKGAAAALVSRRPEGLGAEAPLLKVVDPLTGLEALARAARARAPFENGGLIAVTGSVGKTSTKDMLAHCLDAQAPTHSAVASFNNHWGVPLTLARMPRETRFAVIEIGMNHAGEIRPLSQLARPHAAIVTTVAPVHIEAFDSVEGIADAKAEIFEGLEPGGAAILNRDNAYFDRLAGIAKEHGARVVDFGEAAEAVRLIRALDAPARQSVEAEIFGEKILFKIPQPGRHFAQNALAVLAGASLLGADLSRAALALGTWQAVQGRGNRTLLQIEGAEPVLLVDESYNANPTSLEAALATFAKATPPAEAGQRLVFLTDMLELGADGAALHAQIAEADGIDAVDRVYTAGPLMHALHEALPAHRRGQHVETAEQLAELALATVRPGDAVMVKGSKGSRARLVADRLRALQDNNDD
ncbi:MAG: UDP-N-acetylmuramoyl-tripeptide--D-alanyl-D-alanine ligase [Pseudomonadota bacterium]